MCALTPSIKHDSPKVVLCKAWSKHDLWERFLNIFYNTKLNPKGKKLETLLHKDFIQHTFKLDP